MPKSVFRSDTLEDQVAVVTGAAGGIGRAVCRALAEAGAIVIAADLRQDVSAYQETPYFPIEMDVSDPEAIVRGFGAIVSTHGRVDVLVNAAGVVFRANALDHTVDDWDRVMDINLRGTFLSCQAAVRDMEKRRRGAIVNISSELSLAPKGGRAAYVASKAGINGLTAALALEWAPVGVRVNSVVPGGTDTPMMAVTMGNPEQRDAYLARVADGRLAEPEEIAAAVLYLASDAARHIIGQQLIVDGGYTAG